MILFICSTPIQIVTTINIVATKFSRQKVDVYILDHSPDCYDYFLMLQESELFNAVYFLETKEAYTCHYKTMLTGILSYAKKAYNALNYRWLERKIPNKDSYYEQIFIAYPDLPTQILYYFFKRKNNLVLLNFYEDGLFTYTAFSRKWNLIRVCYSKIVFGSFIFNDCRTVYSYQPSFIKNSNYNLVYTSIPPLEKDVTLVWEISHKLINRNDLSEFKYRFIFFDQPFELESTNIAQKELINLVMNAVGSENVGLKVHPRNYNTNSVECNIIKSRVPFELVEIDLDIENKILLSLYSTACLNPKIVFNKEPYVILLYKLVELPDLDSDVFEVTLDVKGMYAQQRRFFIPETLDELVGVISSIKRELDIR